MKGMKVISLLLAALLGLAGRAYAQQDSIMVNRQAEESIFGLKMQNRYIPEDQLFHEPGRSGFLRALENLSIGAGGSYHRLLDNGMSSGPMASLYLSKWFTPRQGIRIEAGAGYFFDNETRARVKILPDIRISHLFNLSAYLDGYNPASPGYFYLLSGLGYAWRMGSSAPGGNWNAQLGAGYSFRIFRGTDLFVEPVLELDGNANLQQQDGNWRGYYGGIRGNVGLSYRIDRWNQLMPPKTEHQWYWETTGGAAWQRPGGRSGYQLMLGVREKLSPAGSVRLSGVWTQARLNGDWENRFSYGAARLEGMLDLLALGGAEDLPWGISLAAGPEAGAILATKAVTPEVFGGWGAIGVQSFYVGATTALQLRARLYKRFSAILEPRASFIPYVTRGEGSTANNNLDILLSANLGLQYAVPTVQERIDAMHRIEAWDRSTWEDVNARWDRSKTNFQERALPKINLFAVLEGSYFRPLGKDYANGPLASLSVGGWFDDANGMLVNGGLGYFQDLQYNNGYVKTTEFSAAYLLNITRLINGYDPGQVSNISLFLGGGYLLTLREVWKGSPIFRTGLEYRRHVMARTDLVVRPEIDFLKAPSEEWTAALRGTFGLGYSLGGARLARFADPGGQWFFSLGAGYQNELLRLADQNLEEAPLGEYRITASAGRKFNARLAWRLSGSYLSQLQGENNNDSFTHRLRFASVNIDALYDLLGDELEDRKWSLSLMGGPEVGLQHKGNIGESSKGSGLFFGRQTVSAYLGISAGVQVKYRFADNWSVYLEPKYSLAPYVALTSKGEENYYSHIYGTNFGLEFALGRGRREFARPAGTSARRSDFVSHSFIQVSGTSFSPFGRGYSNGPIASLGAGYWFKGPHGMMMDLGVGYFRDNLYSIGVDGHAYAPQHMAAGEIRASYLLNLNRLSTTSKENSQPVEVSLISGIGYLIPEIKQTEKGTLTAHAGFDFRTPLYKGVSLVVQPQLEIFRDPHTVVDGTRTDIGGAFRGTFGLSYSFNKDGSIPSFDPGKDWFIGISGGVQRESGHLPDEDGTELSKNEYRIAVSLGRSYSNALSIRGTGSFSEIFPQESSFLHSLRFVSANLDVLYDLLANERGDNRISLSLLGGPEAGLFNKNYSGRGNESPMTIPIRIGRRTHHGVGAYIGLSAGVQLKVRVFDGLSLYLEPRYSLVPYVVIYNYKDHRNMNSHLWNANLGIQYSFGQKHKP